ncbi:MAG: ChbG/HpnK family deacetylase [Solirubrobacteraceae bacterium]
MSGLLIVNADDLGGNPLATERILAGHRAGVLTSATAMMFMSDSPRAAALAREAGLPVGLHLNLTQAYDDPDVSAPVAVRQRRVTAFMSDPTRRRMGISAPMVRVIRHVILDQLEAFRRLFGSEPTHLDGHNHAHLNPTALAVLPRGIAVRPAFRGPSRHGLRRVPLVARDRWLAARHPVPDHFFALAAIHPELGGDGLDRALSLARTATVEIMAHPDRDATDAVLHSPAWAAALGALRLGTYGDLPGVGRWQP